MPGDIITRMVLIPDQHFVTSCVAVRVVGFLKVVDVQKDDAERVFKVAFFAFGETTELWTWVGAAVIFSSSIYVSWRESKLERKDEALVAAAVGTSPAVDVSGDIEAAVSRAERDDKH